MAPHVVLNGSSWTKCYFDKFDRHLYSNYDVIVLPQTSKQNESGKYKISFEEKLSKWKVLKDVVNAHF